MKKYFFLSLLTTSTITTNHLLADALPTPEKPSTMLGGCKVSLIADSKALSKESNIANALWCVEKMASDSSFKKKNPNFQNQLKTGKLRDAIEMNYSDAEDLDEALNNIEKAAATESIKDELIIRKAKKEAKKEAEKSRAQISDAERLALNIILKKLEQEPEEGAGTLIKKSRITLLDSEPDGYGDTDVTKQAKKPTDTTLTESKANKQKLSNLGYMIATIAKLQGSGAKNIPNHPKFIKAAAASVEDFWSTEDCYANLDEDGYEKVAKLVRDVAIIKGALDLYEEIVKGSKRSGNKNKNASERKVDQARTKLKTTSLKTKKTKMRSDESDDD